MQARPQRMVGTIRAGVQCRQLQDTHLIDRLLTAGQLTAGQHEAALKVLLLHDDAGFEPRQIASYAPRGFAGGHEDDLDEHGATTRFRGLLGDVPDGSAWVLHGMCLGDAPGPRGMGLLVRVLDRLAERWGLG